jgi:hypothetical protein
MKAELNEYSLRTDIDCLHPDLLVKAITSKHRIQFGCSDQVNHYLFYLSRVKCIKRPNAVNNKAVLVIMATG